MMINELPRFRRTSVYAATAAVLSLLALAAAAAPASAQGTPAVASLSRWDVYAATSGNAPAEGTHKLTGISRDQQGNLWVLGQGAGEARVGKIDLANPEAATYTEWTVFKYGANSGDPVAVLVTPAGDVWLGIAGRVPFVRKLANSNTFLDFRRDEDQVFAPNAMRLSADGTRIFITGAEEFGRGYVAMLPATAAASPDAIAIDAWAAPPAHVTRFQPQHVALDGNPNVVWFTISDRVTLASSVARLDVRNGQMLEWPLSGIAASGLSVTASRVCAVTRGGLGQTPAPPGDVECLLVPADNPATPANEMATTAAVRQRFARSAAGALLQPAEVISNGAEMFVSERGGNAIVFVNPADATDAVREDVVAATPLQLERSPLGGFRVVDDWEGPNVARVSAVPLPSASASIAGTQIGAGQVRFAFPAERQSALEPLMRQPRPAAMTPIIVDPAGIGPSTFYLAESFDLNGETFLGARVDRFQVLPPPSLEVRDGSGAPVSGLTFEADLGGSPTTPRPGSYTLSVEIDGIGALPWSASAAAEGFAFSVTPDTGTATETTAATITVTPTTLPTQAGVFQGEVTITSPLTFTSVTIPVTFRMNGAAALSVDRAALTFTTNRGVTPSATVRLSNAPLGASIDWTATGGTPSAAWLGVTPGAGTLAGGQAGDVTVSANPTGVPLNVAQQGSLTFGPANPSSTVAGVTVPVTLTVTAPTIALDAASIAFPSMAPGATQSRTVVLRNTGTGPLNAIVTTGATWLSAAAGSGPLAPGESRVLTVAVDSVGLAPGTHVATVLVSDPVAAALPQHEYQPAQRIDVSVTVTAAAGPTTVVPRALTFETTRWTVCNGDTDGSNPAAQPLVLTNGTDRPIWYLAVPTTVTGGSWLRVTPFTHVLVPGHPRTLSVSVDAEGLAQGTYTATIKIYTLTHPSPNPHTAAIDVTEVPVTFTVRPAAPRLCVSPSSLDFGTLKQSVTSAAKTIAVQNVGDGTVAWTATATAGSGTVTLTRTAAGLAVAVRTSTKKGAQSGKVVISAPGMAPQTVTLKWLVADKNDHHDDDDDCHGDHDHDGDHDQRDHDRHCDHHGHDDHDHGRHDHDRDDHDREHGRCDHDRDGYNKRR